MGKKFYHASHFKHTLKKRSHNRYKRLEPLIKDDSLRILSHVKPTDSSLTKYWRFRKNLFSKIDSNGIYMTHELWFSVTPESIASFFANFVRACMPEAQVILDVFCGGGGNTIQFAKQFPKVYGVDFSLEHLYCTAQNAKVYEVDDRIWLKYGPWEKICHEKYLEDIKVDCIFASPPWGGPNYLKKDIYDLETNLQPMGITKLLESMLKISKNIILFLPRNSDLTQLANVTRKLLGRDAKCRVLYVKENGHLKGIVAIWGDALVSYESGPEATTEKDKSCDEQDEPVQKETIPASFYDMDG
ncbi:similar to Saccharomyces cerevisiae YPL157W TGS1 Trimethyl guanosine synthase [Maudiozyma saulgeensis]|uniref:Trimethylguanosine synthase n=1 Tax=Maudiozyma saulgeensis TaxID=1789683 RepID=A0A1X7R923_9SACH|nr:similar to Saccharomyces cerevisiae YPL157W TGS1 Trimethyl guanosine synthase [Kazachstania saulgeensis]